LLSEAELQPWLQAATDFALNSDFDIESALRRYRNEKAAPPNDIVKLSGLVDVMKAESSGKRTIQALGDKIILSELMRNLGVPQMPLLLAKHGNISIETVEALVKSLEVSEDREEAFAIVAKPTHLSSGEGSMILSRRSWESQGWDAKKLKQHMDKYLAKSAKDCESEALRSLVPGFVVQHRYKSAVDFGLPLEIRVVTLFGKARFGVWWWGRPGTEGAGKKSQRNVWVVRQSTNGPDLENTEGWEVIHEHSGENVGFHRALDLFVQGMPAMAAAAEAIARAVGAPFLRSDFFIGSERWGIRLNEVAYGSGVDCRRAPTTEGHALVDDAPAIAQILQRGLPLCRREAPEHFLSKLGVHGDYTVALGDQSRPGMTVLDHSKTSPPQLPRLLSRVVRSCEEFVGAGLPNATREECETPRPKNNARSGEKQVLPLYTAPPFCAMAAPLVAGQAYAPGYVPTSRRLTNGVVIASARGPLAHTGLPPMRVALAA
jgi:hypothetical protein